MRLHIQNSFEGFITNYMILTDMMTHLYSEFVVSRWAANIKTEGHNISAKAGKIILQGLS